MNDLQKKQLDILKEFIRVCKKHNLHYFLVGGTCLGAIRHKGFIPWDDDIDVGMPRADFDKFMLLQDEFKGTPLFIQNYKTDSKYIYNFAKLRDSSTTFIEDFYANHRINHGVWIDIFPIDGMSYEEKESKKLAYKIRHVWFNIYLAYLPALRRTVRKETWFKDICLNIVAGLFYVFDIAHYRNKYIDRYVRKIDYDKAKMVGNYFGFNMKKEAMPKEWFDEYIEVDFEDIKVSVLKEYDKYLTKLYGNYMKYPPLDKQVGHHYNKGLSLTEGYKDYIKRNRI